MPRYTLVISARIENRLRALSRDEQREAVRLIEQLQEDDEDIDPLGRVPLAQQGLSLTAGNLTWVSFKYIDEQTIWVLDCGRLNWPARPVF